ncbi:MAG: hypothetical protein EOP33_05220 [Rickettsiaceae bacterium]|nr:MAG: hypothetical protein EOP33_05220 [Rickettsiaceae bacterium]
MKLQQPKPIVKTCLHSSAGKQQEIDQLNILEVAHQSLVCSANHSLSSPISEPNYHYSTTHLPNRSTKRSSHVVIKEQQTGMSFASDEALELIFRKIKEVEINVRRNKAIIELTQSLFLDLKSKLKSAKKNSCRGK